MSPTKRRVRKASSPKVRSVSPESPEQTTTRQVRGPYDLYSAKAPGYSQQVLEELLVASENTSELRRIAEATRKDQWRLGKRQLQLEEIRLKVELGMLSKEQAAEELGKLPELNRTKVEYPAHQSVYERWEEVQERLKTERGEEGSEEGEEAEAETVT